MDSQSCPLVKPGKESARNCARQFLTKVMIRRTQLDVEVGYSPDDIEEVIYNSYPNRDSYLDKVAKVGLHLSLFTKTGRISWSFQDKIFGSKQSPVNGEDYLVWLFTRATNEEVFPEIFDSGDYITPEDRDLLVKHMHIEHAALLNGLREIVRRCCDSKVCTVDEINTEYDDMLFRSGTVFETSARSVCMVRKVQDWVPPTDDVFIPDTRPIVERVYPNGPLDPDPDYTEEEILSPEDFDGFLQDRTILRQRTIYQSQRLDKQKSRNFEASGQITCLNVDNLIHNLAELPDGKYLELPWEGELLSSQIQEQLMEQYRVEIALRKYYLKMFKK